MPMITRISITLVSFNPLKHNQTHVSVRLKGHFTHKSHLCLVFELLSFNLYDLLRNTNFRGVSLNLTRKFAVQVRFTSLKTQFISFSWRRRFSSCLLLSSPSSIAIWSRRMFSSSILSAHKSRSLTLVLHAKLAIESTNTSNPGKRTQRVLRSDWTFRFYRSPEVLLGIAYDTKIDMWSLGCILVEMHTGEPLFAGSSEIDQMMKIVEVLGMPPRELLDQGPKTYKFFDKTEGSLPSSSLQSL